jgi:HlyD family secretion protein
MLSGAIAVLGVGGWWAYQHWFQATPAPVPVSLIAAQRGQLEVTISESGIVALEGEQTLKSPEDVTVERVFVQAGDRVKAGAPLIVLRNRTDQQQQQAQIVENQKALLDLSRKQEIVRERQIQLRNAEKRLQESQELLRQGFIAETEVQNDRDRFDTARSGLKDAETEQQKALLDVQKGQVALREIQQRLGDNRLNSPMDALILSVDVKPGDGAKRETNLLTLGDPSRETVDLHLTTLNAAKVRINQVARVSMIGPNPKTFTGRVISLAPQATSQKSDGSSSAQAQAKVQASVVLDRPSKVLIPGSQVSVEIVLNRRQNVIVLPLDAIQQLESQPFVWVKNRAGQAEKRTVQLGLQSLTTAEVTSGLQAGERVAVPSPNQTLNPGAVLQEAPTPADSSPSGS